MQNATTVVMAEGALGFPEVKIIAAAIGALIEQGRVRIIVDWTKAEWIDPLAIGLLLDRRHKLMQKNGELKFCRMTEEIRAIFCKFRVDKFFEIYATLEDALSSFDDDWGGAEGTVH